MTNNAGIIDKLTSHMDDVQALARLKEGDREAFDELYRKYWRRLYDSAYRRLLSREDSEEVVQDLFVYIWSRRESLHITTTLEAYLLGALKFSIYNFIRSQKVKESYLSSLNQTAPAEQNFIEDAIYYEELATALERSIEHLPEKLKRVYLLSRKEYFSYKEIAIQLNIPLDTVEKHMGKALKLLRKNLKDFVATLLVWMHTLTI